jgi:membrane protease YdiL (CAAX protease family)
MFRGKKVGILMAIVLQAFIFIFLHLDARLDEFPLWAIRAFPVFLTGLMLGGAYFLFNRNLWPLIIAHGTLINIYYIMVYNDMLG